MYNKLIGLNPRVQYEGTLIAIEGTDCSFKNTVAKGLTHYFREQGRKVTMIEYPRYNQDNMAVKHTMDGSYARSASAVDPQQGAIGYSVDRMDDYIINWGKDYNAGGIIIADRYSGSNITHHSTKIEDYKTRLELAKTLLDTEHNRLGLPRPTKVIFLDMPPQLAQGIRIARGTGHEEAWGDINESDQQYQITCHSRVLELLNDLGWIHIKCYNEEDMSIKTREDLLREVLAAVLD